MLSCADRARCQCNWLQIRWSKSFWVKSLSSMEPCLALLVFGTIRHSLDGADGVIGPEHLRSW